MDAVEARRRALIRSAMWNACLVALLLLPVGAVEEHGATINMTLGGLRPDGATGRTR
jgi:hypothetical protein